MCQTLTLQAANQLATDNVNLAYHYANRAAFGQPFLLDDLTSVAMDALIKASRRYKPVRGAPFAAYAGKCIRLRILSFFIDRDWKHRGRPQFQASDFQLETVRAYESDEREEMERAEEAREKIAQLKKVMNRKLFRMLYQRIGCGEKFRDIAARNKLEIYAARMMVEAGLRQARELIPGNEIARR